MKGNVGSASQGIIRRKGRKESFVASKHQRLLADSSEYNAFHKPSHLEIEANRESRQPISKVKDFFMLKFLLKKVLRLIDRFSATRAKLASFTNLPRFCGELNVFPRDNLLR